ncbi:DNA metabolism protein [Lithospermum erythrorhizon]|uniref:DNA metabolism protein n=1 Tax=Lithospermum erythrorhizon TaxID=34254 RepID=A0AAV3NKJ6_LITER
MQASDMRALRPLSSHKHHFFNHLHTLHKPKSAYFIPFYANDDNYFKKMVKPLNPSSIFSRQFTSPATGNITGWLSSAEDPNLDYPIQESVKSPNLDDPIKELVEKSNLGTIGNSLGSESGSGGVSGDDGVKFDFGRRVYGEGIGGTGSKGKGKGKGKSRTVYVCSSCGYETGQWWGHCRKCNAAGTMTRFALGEESNLSSGMQVSENLTRSWLGTKEGEAKPMRLTEVNKRIDQTDWRIPLSGLFGAEVANVLGGGLVPGSLILVGGDPGVGKSTLLLQIAAIIAEGHGIGGSAPVVYVSGEESVEQIGNRADRMTIDTEELFIYSSTDVEDILEKSQVLSPRAIIVDSIQTVYLKGVTGSAGGIYQVKECTSAFLRFAKKTNIPILLIGHVTKTGDIAGPRVLEHIVDVVLYMEGDKYSSHRLLRSVKNRFGSTDELGVFEMAQSGLRPVTNASEMFLSEDHLDSDVLAGLAVAAIMDGSRTFVIEIQALCVAGSSIMRQVNGVQTSRADMIISVLIKQAGLRLQENGVFINVISGVNVTETAGDLAVAAAICSSFLEFPLPSGIAFIGEIGLGGEIRSVPRMDKRIHTVTKLGYRKCVVPKSAEKCLSDIDIGGIEVVGCQNLKEMINKVFRKSSSTVR